MHNHKLTVNNRKSTTGVRGIMGKSIGVSKTVGQRGFMGLSGQSMGTSKLLKKGKR